MRFSRARGPVWLGKAGWSLSSAYDLNPAPTDLKTRVQTTNIDLDEATCSLELLEVASEFFGLTLLQARAIIKKVAAGVDDGRDQAGFLIYTAAADSDGTLGGLVELGKPENLGRLMRQALDRAHICASDPLCAEHDPSKDQSLHGASCHACSFVAETSCERGNRHLDRSLVVPTLETLDAAFFETT